MFSMFSNHSSFYHKALGKKCHTAMADKIRGLWKKGEIIFWKKYFENKYLDIAISGVFEKVSMLAAFE